MRTLINYIRSCFCKHEWEMIFNTERVYRGGDGHQIKVYRCTKCGYSQTYTDIYRR